MHYATFFRTLFNWPAGIIVGNLIASLVWAIIAALGLYMYHRIFIKPHHDEIRDLLNPHTPGGIRDVLEELRKRGPDA